MTCKNDATTPSWPAPRHLPRSHLHRVAWRDVGAPAGEPWLLLHGGPGSGCQPGMLAPFDLRRQRVIAVDQRGAGASRPHGRVPGNHLQALVADLEALRRQLGLQRWALLAGSWGTVVALAYARQYPQRVQRLVLRGAFGLTRREVGGLLEVRATRWRLPGGAALWPARAAMPLPALLARLEQLLRSATPTAPRLHAQRGWALRELRDALHGLRRSLRHARGAELAARRPAWKALARQRRRALAGLRLARATPADRRLWVKYRLQAHYLRRRGFMRPGGLDAAVLALAQSGTPVQWLHGRFDAICPPQASRRWAAMGAGRGAPAACTLPASGHLGHEAQMLQALRASVRSAIQAFDEK